MPILLVMLALCPPDDPHAWSPDFGDGPQADPATCPMPLPWDVDLDGDGTCCGPRASPSLDERPVCDRARLFRRVLRSDENTASCMAMSGERTGDAYARQSSFLEILGAESGDPLDIMDYYSIEIQHTGLPPARLLGYLMIFKWLDSAGLDGDLVAPELALRLARLQNRLEVAELRDDYQGAICPLALDGEYAEWGEPMCLDVPAQVDPDLLEQRVWGWETMDEVWADAMYDNREFCGG